MKWYKVKVIFNDGEIYFDEILGKNKQHALKRAYWNWEEAARIEVLD